MSYIKNISYKTFCVSSENNLYIGPRHISLPRAPKSVNAALITCSLKTQKYPQNRRCSANNVNVSIFTFSGLAMHKTREHL